MGKKLKKKVPELRFPEFHGNWITDRIDYFLVRYVNSVDVQLETQYKQIGIRSHGKGIFHKDPVTGEELGNKRVYWVHPEAFTVNIVFAWEQAVALTSSEEEGYIASHRFLMFLPKQNRADLKFVLLFFLRKRGKHLLELASPGGAGRNKTLGQESFAELEVTFPQRGEQEKIASFLGAIATRLTQLRRKHELLQTYKRGVRQKIFSQQIRFKQPDGSPYPDWEYKELGAVLDYEQPTNYLVSSTEYNDSFSTPVLTAGKSFLLGYTNETNNIFCKLPTIIFDDFTTSFKFVNFPFKAKSSAMKMLLPKNKNVNIKYIFEVMKTLKISLGDDHKRYWISEYQYLEIAYPVKEEQEKIVDFLTALDRKIEAISKKIALTEQFKKGLLQKMFV
jgi:type I restriction enzyme S subunit